jgi:acyl-CoA thioesterase-2
MASVDRLLDLLDLERLDRDLFRARNAEDMRGGRVFGGQVAAQALRAATLTVEVDHAPHSLHGYFLRPGDPGIPTVLSVDRIRDGRSFTTRRVVAIQNGEAIFSLSSSFHKAEDGGEYQLPIAEDVRDPDDDSGPPSPFGRFGAMSPLDIRELGPTPPDDRGIYASTRRVWVRTSGAVPDDAALRACIVTYISDMGVVMAARVPVTGQYGFPGAGMGMAASLDHSVWFHRDIHPDDWMLMDLRSISNAGARGLVQGTIHARTGALGAAIAQEGLVRTGPPG